MSKLVAQMQAWSRMAPPGPANSKLSDGPINDALKLPEAENSVILIIDSLGRVFQLHGGKISDGDLYQVLDGRSAVVGLLDQYGVMDGPQWPDPAEEEQSA